MIQRVPARRIISTYHLSIEWHLLMDSTRHTLTTDVTEMIAHILCDNHSHVKLKSEYTLRELTGRLYDGPCMDNPANKIYAHLDAAEMRS